MVLKQTDYTITLLVQGQTLVKGVTAHFNCQVHLSDLLLFILEQLSII